MPFHSFTVLDTPDGPMSTYVATPGGSEKRPAVVVIQGMHGAESFELEVAERLANAGYVAVVPDMFHRGPACNSTEELDTRRRGFDDHMKISDVNAAIEYLKNHPNVQADHIGIMGFCMGGRTSYLMATVSPDIRAAADFYGGGVPGDEGVGSPLDRTPNIQCPIIIFDGEEDTHPSPEEVRSIGAQLERHGKVHEIHLYPGVGHAFMSAKGARRRAEAIDDAWSRLLGWFEKYLALEPAVSRS
jgi:carboxymethylenebutenolidase